MKTASEFLAATATMSLAQRESAILAMIDGGYLSPSSVAPVPIAWDENGHRVEIRVSADYVEVGDDVDALRMPMLPKTAQRCCDVMGAALPTRKLVNAIMQHAATQLVAKPLGTVDMRKNAKYARSHALIEDQLRRAPSYALGQLIAGHKKDIVVTQKRPDRNVAIYGFCKTLKPTSEDTNVVRYTAPDGFKRAYAWWQPLYVKHDDQWVDYSHGTRLVFLDVRIDGNRWAYADVLAHPEFHRLLSDEGPITKWRY